MSARSPLDPHAFEQEKLRLEVLHREVSLVNEYQADTRARVDTLAKTVFLLSGGALTLSIGLFIREGAPQLLPIQVTMLASAWWSLFGAMVGFALVTAIMITQAYILGITWKALIEGEKREMPKALLGRLTVANWAVGGVSLLAFVYGLGVLAWLASNLV